MADRRTLKATPHVAQNTSRHRSRIDERTLRHAGSAISQRCRKRIEECSAGSRRWLAIARLQAGLECETAVSIILFDFEGCDEMDPIRGTGTAELAEDGSLEVEIGIHHSEEILA